ncbi:MAG: sigma-70 family RNA polymerase sigma factor [Bacillota bacterium]
MGSVIDNEILMYLRSIKRSRTEVSLNDPIGVDKEGNEITLLDVLGTDEDSVPEIVGQRCEMKMLLDKIGQLETSDRAVLELRYGLRDGFRRTQREIAKVLGISRSYVSRIEKRAIQAITRSLETGSGLKGV